jgi:hypothetical protein
MKGGNKLEDREQFTVEEQIFNKMSPEIKNESVPVARFAEIGSTGLNRWGQDVYEEFLPNLRWPRAAKVYKEMSSNDPVITAILLCCRQLIRKVTWRVVPVSDKKEDMLAAQFLEECQQDMSMTWEDLIDEVISCFEYGWSYHELIYKRRLGSQRDGSKNSKYNDGRIGWRKIPGRSQESWGGWEFDASDDGALAGMWQYSTTVGGKVLIPIEKGLLFRTTAARNNPEGRSFLRGAYRPWYFKKHIEEIEGIGIERDLAGLPVLNAPEGVDIWDEDNPKSAKILAACLNMVKSIRRDKNEGIVLPSGYELKLLSSDSKRQFDTNAIINRYDQRIAITLLSDIVMLGADKVGSFALANVKKSLLATSLDAQVQAICGIFNKYAIPRLFAINAFPGVTQLPQLTASPVDCPDLKDLADYIQKLSGCGMPLFPNIDLENYLRGVANLPSTSENDPAREAAMEKNSKKDDSNSKKVKEGGKEDGKENKD